MRIELHDPLACGQRPGEIAGGGVFRGDMHAMRRAIAMAGPAKSGRVEEGEGDQVRKPLRAGRRKAEVHFQRRAPGRHHKAMLKVLLVVPRSKNAVEMVMAHSISGVFCTASFSSPPALTS